MTDIWSFLLQTLTASGAAALLLAVKWMFRDKLSPRWQFPVWGVLALVLLLPAGWGGRYILFNWPLAVEWAKSAVTGEFGTLSKVTAPIPLPPLAAPETLWDGLYLVYAAGVAVLLARYMASYIRLRLALKRGRRVRDGRVRAVAEEYGLPVCSAVEVDGLSTAFICGVVRPVLALPAGMETDGKVILHELLHTPVYDHAGEAGPDGQDSPKISSERTRWGEHDLKEYWSGGYGDWIFLTAGGGGYEGRGAEAYRFPSFYAAELYLNGAKAAELTLLPVGGGEWIAF